MAFFCSNGLVSFRPRDALSAENLIALLEETEKLKETLMTRCKAAETIAAADSKNFSRKSQCGRKSSHPAEGVPRNTALLPRSIEWADIHVRYSQEMAGRKRKI